MERLLGIWIEEMSVEHEDGSSLRHTVALMDALQVLCPFVEAVRLGFFVLPIRGPSRFFGGDEAVMAAVRQSVLDVTGFVPRMGIGEGLFCTEIAAKKSLVLEAGESDLFRRSLSLDYLGRKDIATTCRRLGLHTIGAFADLDRFRVAERFNKHALALHALAQGETTELKEQRDPAFVKKLRRARGEHDVEEEQMGFFGQRGAGDLRAEAAAHRVRRRLGADAVVVAALRGGRVPEDRATLVPWGSPEQLEVSSAPWPGQLRAPSPTTTLKQPVEIQLRDEHDQKVVMLSRGLLSATPHALLFASQLRRDIVWFAGPWPLVERWWASSRKRAHVQVLLVSGEALLLTAESSRWWLVGIYD